MFEFCIALTAFLVAHLIPASRSLRARLILLMGRTAYLVAYSILSLVLLGWLIVAAQRADTVWLWDPAPWQWHVPFIAMPMATFLLVAGLLSANPLSISLRGGTTPGPITAITRHPVLWAFLIWATAHIPPNGTGVALLLFGAMALFSLFGFILLDLKARKRLGPERWREAGGRNLHSSLRGASLGAGTMERAAPSDPARPDGGCPLCLVRAAGPCASHRPGSSRWPCGHGIAPDGAAGAGPGRQT